MKDILEELREIKELLRIIACNTEQLPKDSIDLEDFTKRINQNLSKIINTCSVNADS